MEITFNRKIYTKCGGGWVSADGAVLGQAYIDNVVLAPAVGRYAVDLARAGNDPLRRSQTLEQVRRSLGNGVVNAVMTLAGDLRSSGAVLV